jgi:predicted RNA-binding Zn-ribbon protein involved in translation (DUF1610 family)
MPLNITCPGCRATLRVREEYAGQQMKCPRCGGSVPVTASEPLTVEPVQDVVAAGPSPGARPEGPTKPCPACHHDILRSARKCRYCGTWLDEPEDDYEDDDDRPRSYKPCPRCGSPEAERVVFTFWGSFYGPALLTHVRCPECGYSYNGRTGRSNLVPAITFVAVPLILIVAILTGLAVLIVKSAG